MPGRTEPVHARPFLKWAGGKTQLLKQYAPLYPDASDLDRYIEPFLGSAAVFFDVRRVLKPRRVILGDGNDELVNVYTVVRDQVEELIRALARHRRSHGKEHYYRVRSRGIARLSAVARAARLIYLNRTCFNGLYRVNRNGLFNVPMGRYANPRILDVDRLRAASVALRGTRITVSDFRRITARARPGDFIYFDPPYYPLSDSSSFTSYTSGSFREEDQRELARVYAQLSDKGCLVMLSNSDCRFVRDLYRAFDIRTVHASRAINSRAERRGRIQEVVVLNYRPRGFVAGASAPDAKARLQDQ